MQDEKMIRRLLAGIRRSTKRTVDSLCHQLSTHEIFRDALTTLLNVASPEQVERVMRTTFEEWSQNSESRLPSIINTRNTVEMLLRDSRIHMVTDLLLTWILEEGQDDDAQRAFSKNLLRDIKAEECLTRVERSPLN